MGESSGGFSVLQSLITLPDLYRAGIAQAPVTDQFALGEATHKFERYYNDSLLGALPGAAAIYRERSPLFNANAIQTPVALFHGEQDNVVPPNQSQGVAEVLRRNGVPHVFKLYPDEGHSIRRPANVADYYDTVLRFLMQYVIYD
jgi:dipeptidyl aminopeptidase/acylaminoacyl peptidase